MADRAPKPPPGEWARKANCVGVSAELFFPGRGEWTPATAVAVADVCGRCVVRSECLEYALSEPTETHGVWGGVSIRELKRESKRRAAS